MTEAGRAWAGSPKPEGQSRAAQGRHGKGLRGEETSSFTGPGDKPHAAGGRLLASYGASCSQSEDKASGASHN